jgi:transcriptional regulator with PAS, ATPase and Fis domain
MVALDTTYELLGIRGIFASPTMLRLMEQVRRYANADSAVLIEGESGSGKELVARALHVFSRRCAKPWVDINCAALPEHLVESEMFGYEKGAFSGADVRKPGLFELADTGTLFLDEVVEFDGKLQAKLLRVLDCGSFYRLGGTKKVQVDVRIVAATNQDLTTAMNEGRFRKDLYHRLGQLRISVPPLRDRKEDVLPLAKHFLEQCRPEATLSPDAVAALQLHRWPGNVRELRNVIVASALVCESSEIIVEDLPFPIQDGWKRSTSSGGDLWRLSESVFNGGALDQIERGTILKVLVDSDGYQERAAKVLGISTRTLSRKLKSYRMGPDRASRAAGAEG